MTRERRERYLEKTEKIETRVSDIETWIKDLTESEFERDKKTRLAVYKAFQEATEAVSDICAMFLSDRGKVVGDDYENIEKASGNLFSESLEQDLKNSNGLRNRIIHEYNGLTNKLAYNSIKQLSSSLKKFAKEARKWIKDK